jgi:hypothetical protein
VGTITGTITITDNATGSPHTVSLTGTGASSGGGCTSGVLSNGGFEAGNLSCWTTGGVSAPTISTVQKHSGSYSALLGVTSGTEPNGDSSLVQTISIPSGATATLSFWYWPSTTDSITYDWQEAQVRNTSGTMLAQIMKVCSNAQAWTQVTYNLSSYAGQTIQLYFNDHGDGYGDLTYMYLDDVAVTITQATPSFSLAASPTAVSVAQGKSGTSTITSTVSGGFNSSVALSASGQPSGVTVSFNPASLAAPGSGSSTMTMSVASTVAAGTYAITVTGTGGSQTHTTTVNLTVTVPSSQLIVNGGFETGSLSSWTISGTSNTPAVSTAQKHSGSYSALLGTSSGTEPNGDSSFYQTITIPSTATTATLTFWYWPSTTDTITYDWQEAQVQNTSGTMLAQIMKVCSNAQAWTQVSYNLISYKGQTVRIYFNDHEDGYGDLTYMYLDDVAVNVQ